MLYNIDPTPKPRMTQADRWRKRPCVLRYFDFKDKCRDTGLTFPNYGAHLTFHVPMPKSWSKKKRKAMVNTPHQQRPDVDNYLKATMDAVLDEDSGVYDVRASKYWAETGAIEIRINN